MQMPCYALEIGVIAMIRIDRRTTSLAVLLGASTLFGGCGGANVIKAYSGPKRDTAEVSVIRSLPLCEEPTDDPGTCRPGHPEGKVLPSQHLHGVVLLAIDGHPVKLGQDGKAEPAIEEDGSYVVHALPGKHTLSVARVDVTRGDTMRVSVSNGEVSTGMAKYKRVIQVGDKLDFTVDLEAAKTYEFAEWTGAIVTEDGSLFPDPPLNPPLSMPGASIGELRAALAKAALASLSPVRLAPTAAAR
jgi:hypothetical protein